MNFTPQFQQFQEERQKERVFVHDLRSGDVRAVEEWYRLYKQKMLRYVNQKIGDSRDAEEVMHDIFLSCLESLPLFHGQSMLWTWMCAIARHEIADYFRKKYAKKLIKSIPLIDAILPLVGSRSGEDTQSTTEEIQLALRELSDRDREILLMKYIDKLHVSEIARKFGVSLKSMESSLFRARKLFRSLYERSCRNATEAVFMENTNA